MIKPHDKLIVFINGGVKVHEVQTFTPKRRYLVTNYGLRIKNTMAAVMVFRGGIAIHVRDTTKKLIKRRLDEVR